MLLFTIYSAELHSIGQVDPESMPDQTLMELLVGDAAQHNAALEDIDGSFLDIQSWPGLTFDDAGKVMRIEFSADFGAPGLFGSESESDDDGETYIIGPEGSIDIKWIPKSDKVFEIRGLNLEGTVKTGALPEALEQFNISSNCFRGTFCVASLPQKLEYVNISLNILSGTLDISKLPPLILGFSAEANKFHGSLDFSQLPEKIIGLRLSNNAFYGEIDLSKIPSSIRFFTLRGSAIQQAELVIKVPPEGTQFFRLSSANFQRIIDTDGKDLSSALLQAYPG